MMRYLVIFLILMVIAVLLSCTGCDSRWNHEMPPDGTMLCSATGEGFIVYNNAFKFTVGPWHEFDAACKALTK